MDEDQCSTTASETCEVAFVVCAKATEEETAALEHASVTTSLSNIKRVASDIVAGGSGTKPDVEFKPTPISLPRDHADMYQYVSLAGGPKAEVQLMKPVSETAFPTYESGVDGYLKDLLMCDLEESKQINVVLLGFKGKGKTRRAAAPEPDEFARIMQALASKSEEEEVAKKQGLVSESGERTVQWKPKDGGVVKMQGLGSDQKVIIDATQKYAKIFRQVMELDREDFQPSLGGGLDAVAELLDDVRTGAWSFAAFIFSPSRR